MKSLRRWAVALFLSGMALCATCFAEPLQLETAKAYHDILQSQVSIHGYADYESWEGSSGLLYSNLVDFDGDGKEELVCFISTTSERIVCRMWGEVNGTVQFLGEVSIQALPCAQVELYFARKGQEIFVHQKHAEGDGNYSLDLDEYLTLQDGHFSSQVTIELHQSRDPDNPSSKINMEYIKVQGTGKVHYIKEKDYTTTLAQYHDEIPLFIKNGQSTSFTFSPGQEQTLNNTIKLLADLAAQKLATPTATKITVNGVAKSFDAYTIENNNYFKIRDLAAVLNGTGKQFSVGWDQASQTITLTSGQPYQAVGGELSATVGGGTKTVAPGNSKVQLDGKEVYATAYVINGNHYFKLRDLAQALNFGVTWDAVDMTIGIDCNTGYQTGTGAGTGTVLPVTEEMPKPAVGVALQNQATHITAFRRLYPDIPLLEIITDDFDQDGVFESFVYEDTVGFGHIWFIRENRVVLVTETMGVYAGVSVLKYPEFKHIILWIAVGADGTGTQNIYSVKNGKPNPELSQVNMSATLDTPSR